MYDYTSEYQALSQIGTKKLSLLSMEGMFRRSVQCGLWDARDLLLPRKHI